VSLGAQITSIDQYKETLNSERTVAGIASTDVKTRNSSGKDMMNMNNYLSQTGKEKVDPNRFNYRRTTRDYDIQQPNFMRHLEEGSKWRIFVFLI